jgi:hypothetical protein
LIILDKIILYFIKYIFYLTQLKLTMYEAQIT